MTILSVTGYPDGPAALSQIDVEGSASDADKVEVTLEITGKELARTASVRKDGTWTARFKASQSTSLVGFTCGALVAARVEGTDGSTSRAEWVGCVDCEDPEHDSDRASEKHASSDKRALQLQSAGDGAQGRQAASESPLLVVERPEAGDEGDVLLRVKVAEEPARSRRWPTQGSGDDGDPGNSGPSNNQSGGLEAGEDATPRVGTRTDDTAPGDARDDPEAERDTSSGEAEAASEDDGTPLWLGGVLVLSELAVLVSLVAQGYPILIAFAVGVALPVSAMFVAKNGARAWATWSMAGVGLAAVVIAALLPFVGFVSMDTYLIAAGIAAAGLLVGSALLPFVGGSDDS